MNERKELIRVIGRMKKQFTPKLLSAFLCVVMALALPFFALPEKNVYAETSDDVGKQIFITVENKHDKKTQTVNPQDWGDDVYVFWWYKKGSDAKGPEWPGVKMDFKGTVKDSGHRVYQYSFIPEGVVDGILLNDGTGLSGVHQTYDISISPEGSTEEILAWLKYGTTAANITNSGLYLTYRPFTYDDSIKLPSAIKTEPTALTLTENGSEQALVNAGETEDGTMNYALGKDASTTPTNGWSKEIPTGKAAGTYYVWYKVAGDGIHRDSEAKCVAVTISAKSAKSTTCEVVDKKQKTTSVSKLKAGKKCITVIWKKQTKGGIAGYEIQYSTNKSFKKNVKTATIKKAKTTSKKIKKLKSKKKYFVRIRTFKVSNGEKVYSRWSKTKSVKVK